MPEELQHYVDILVYEKCIPEKIEKNQVYVLHYTIPDEDGLVGANRTSIHLFKTLKSLVKFIISEAGIENYQEFRNNFQEPTSEDSDVWDVIVLEVER